MSGEAPRQAILSSESQTVREEDAQSMNIAAGKAIGDTVRTTLGPRGMDKLLVDSSGMGIVTNNGASILREMDIKHPAANLVANIAKKQEETVGDGTTTAIALASALLGEAEDLLENGLHPTVIAKGYALAHTQAIEALTDAAFELDYQRELVEQLVRTTMSGKSPGEGYQELASVTTDAAMAAHEAGSTPADHVHVIPDVGGIVAETWLLDGVILKKERAHPEMPPLVRSPSVAVLDGAIDTTECETTQNVTISDAQQLENLRAEEHKLLTAKVDHLLDLDIDVVICEKNVANVAQQRLAEEGVYVARRQSPDGIEKASQATGATVRPSVTALSEDDLGTCETVSERAVGGEKRTSIEGVPRENAVSIVVRGGTRNVVDEIHRSIDDALGAAGVALTDGAVVSGGGGAEICASTAVRDEASSINHRLQLAMNAFADALEIIPYTLAENSGRSPLDCIVDLRHAYDGGDIDPSIDAETGAIVDAREQGIFDALRVKTQALESATQAATMLLRIDDVVATGDLAGGEVTNNVDAGEEPDGSAFGSTPQ